MNILVTGGASGLGAAIVQRAAADNNNMVYFTYASSVDAATALEAQHSNTKALHCDFTDPASVDSFVSTIQGLGVDVLVNNAYVGINKDHFYKADYTVFQKSFEQNIIPTLRITQESIKVFRKKKAGRIINIITSFVLNKPPTGLSEYVANKAYLLSMSRSWAAEYSRLNITSNCISPAFMETSLTRYTDERLIEQMKDGHPLKKLLTTEEVAETVFSFMSMTKQINGTNLVINVGEDMI